VLSDVVVGTIAWVEIIATLKSRVWKALLVGSEGDTLGSQKIPDVGYVGWNLVEVIVVHIQIVTTVDGTMLWLRWMGHREIIGEGKTLSS
jgi:hypothetical protein